MHIFDSLRHAPSADTLETIAKFVKCKPGHLQVKVMNVQQQPNAHDCGLFAVAFAAALAHGEDPTEWLSGMRCRLAYGPADATATHYLLLQQMQIGFTILAFTFLVPAHPGSPAQIPEEQ